MPRQCVIVYSLQARRPGCTDETGDRMTARWVFRESFVDGAPDVPTGSRPSAIRVSQFKGGQPDNWYPRLSTYDRVDLGEVYPGVRVTLRAAGNNVEKLMQLSPESRASTIKIAVDGVESLSLDDQKRLRLQTGLGEIVFTAPVAYQTIDGVRKTVDVSYTLAENVYGFELGDHHPAHDVVIDPLLASTFIGGSNPSPPGNYDDDIVHDMIAVGDSIYIAGATQSPDFPIHMGYDETIGGNFPDGFVTRMSSDLSTVVASTFIGTQYSDSVRAITIDDAGLIVVAGQAGWGFPVTDGAYTHSGSTPTGGGFVSKFSPDLSTLVASAIPAPADFPRALARGNGGFYFGGSTNYPDFPITPGAYRSTCCPPGGFGIRPYEGFAGKISDDLSTLQAMTSSASPGETGGSGMPQMLVANDDFLGSTLTVTYEPGCNTTDHNLYYGLLEDVSDHAYAGQFCDVGRSGTNSFHLPSGSYFFVIVGDNDSVEGSYGRDSAGVERPASGACGLGQDLTNSCEVPGGP